MRDGLFVTGATKDGVGALAFGLVGATEDLAEFEVWKRILS
jgi:hypothetical protein